MPNPTIPCSLSLDVIYNYFSAFTGATFLSKLCEKMSFFLRRLLLWYTMFHAIWDIRILKSISKYAKDWDICKMFSQTLEIRISRRAIISTETLLSQTIAGGVFEGESSLNSVQELNDVQTSFPEVRSLTQSSCLCPVIQMTSGLWLFHIDSAVVKLCSSRPSSYICVTYTLANCWERIEI